MTGRRMKRAFRGLAAGLGFAILVACGASHPTFIKKDLPPLSGRLAVLPLNNMTTDLDGPRVVRGLVQSLMAASGFDTVPEEEVDNNLRIKLGITDGGQLRSASPEKIGEVVDAPLLVFGDLEEFNYINVGFFQNRIVGARFWLMDVSSGEMLWEDTAKVTDPSFATDTDEAKAALVIGLGGKWAERVLKSPLLPESALVVNQAFDTFPKRVPGSLPVPEVIKGRRRRAIKIRS